MVLAPAALAWWCALAFGSAELWLPAGIEPNHPLSPRWCADHRYLPSGVVHVFDYRYPTHVWQGSSYSPVHLWGGLYRLDHPEIGTPARTITTGA